MKVSELIEKLQALPQDSDVVVAGYEGGVSDVTDADPGQANCNVHSSWYYGAHEMVDDYAQADDTVKNVVLIW